MNLGVFKRRIDVDVETQMTPLKSLYASGDKNAHTFELSLYRGTQEMDLSGASAQGYFIRADGYTIPITGAISGNVVTLTLSESCYYVVGNFNLIIKVSIGEIRKSVFWGNGYVVRSMTDTIVDEENVIPSLDELLAQIAAAESAAKAANQAASAARIRSNQRSASGKCGWHERISGQQRGKCGHSRSFRSISSRNEDQRHDHHGDWPCGGRCTDGRDDRGGRTLQYRARPAEGR